jgi:hypothetical protein
MTDYEKVNYYLSKPHVYYSRENRREGEEMIKFVRTLKGGSVVRNGCSDCIPKAWYFLKSNYSEMVKETGERFLINSKFNSLGWIPHGKRSIYRNETTTEEEREEVFKSLDSKRQDMIFEMSTCIEKEKRKRRTKKELEEDLKTVDNVDKDSENSEG